jgi:DNA-directed RNA polymerase subunit alpha
MAVTRIPIPDWARTQKADDRFGLSLAEIDLSVRTVNCLEDQGIFTVQDLLSCKPQRLLEIPNLGEKTLELIYAALEKIGFYRPSGQPVERQGEQPVEQSDFALLRK